MRPQRTVTPAKYKREFIARVRAARTLSGKSPAQIAAELGIEKGTYHRYETRTLLPLNLIAEFCQLTGISIEELIAGPRRPRSPTRPPSPDPNSIDGVLSV